jgi:hypothetical protein
MSTVSIKFDIIIFLKNGICDKLSRELINGIGNKILILKYV